MGQRDLVKLIAKLGTLTIAQREIVVRELSPGRKLAPIEVIVRAAPKELRAQLLTGVAETDDSYFLRSSKGQRQGMSRSPRKLDVEHHAINVAAGVRGVGAWHVQNVNSYHSQLKDWMRQFRGVATKYLDSYLGWFRAIEQSSRAGLDPALLLAVSVSHRHYV